MARTTIAFEPGLLRQLKIRAASRDETLQKTVNDLVRQALQPRSPKPRQLKLRVNRSRMNPNLDVSSRDSIAEILGGRWG